MATLIIIKQKSPNSAHASLSVHCKTCLVFTIALLKLNTVSCSYAEALNDTTSVSGEDAACLYLLNHNSHVKVIPLIETVWLKNITARKSMAR